jgi:hypothetical protein
MAPTVAAYLTMLSAFGLKRPDTSSGDKAAMPV